jgi:hypothetical protein
MKIVVDEVKLARNAKLARGLVLGVVVVAVGMMILVLLATMSPNNPVIANLNPATLLLVEIIVIVVLFVVSRIGFIFANRYLAFTRPEKVLRDSLKGLEKTNSLLLFQKPVDYLLIEPGGVTVFIPRAQEQKVAYRNGKWSYNRGFLRAWMGRDESIGDPSADAAEAVKKVQAVIAAKAPDVKVTVRPIIVFTHPKVELDVQPGPVAVLKADDIKDFLRGGGRLSPLPKPVQRKVRAALGAPEGDE